MKNKYVLLAVCCFVALFLIGMAQADAGVSIDVQIGPKPEIVVDHVIIEEVIPPPPGVGILIESGPAYRGYHHGYSHDRHGYSRDRDMIRSKHWEGHGGRR